MKKNAISERRIVIGLTGGIASGKSAALSAFRQMGAKTIDCDLLARQAVMPGSPALRKIKKVFGPGVMVGNNLDRQAMAALVFSRPAARKKLEAIVHPEVIKKLKGDIRRHRFGLLVADVPLLFEARLKNLFDKIVVVWVPERTQILRLMRRSNLSRPEAKMRLSAQIPLARKRAQADFVVDNSRSPQHSRAQIRSLLAHIADEQAV